MNTYNISVLLPSRGRTEALMASIKSLFTLAKYKDKIQLLLGFDNDDDVGISFYKETVEPWLKENEIVYKASKFQPMGYSNLNKYYNTLAMNADADWLFVWNDDALMETHHWDDLIVERKGEFKLFAVNTHMDHPYSIFPIMPMEWYNLIGYLSKHQMVDAEVSQIGYILDIYEKLDIYVIHDRFDLTGNNDDETNRSRVRHELNPSSPLDFSNPLYSRGREADALKIANHLRAKGYTLKWYDSVVDGTQYPWAKMMKNDPNRLTQQWTIDPATNQLVKIDGERRQQIIDSIPT